MDDARLVQMALTQGLVTQEQVASAEKELRALQERGLDNSVWYLLQDLGFLTEEAARKLRKVASSSGLTALEVDGYVIQGRLGAGGMGDVYRARNAAGREAAVKLLGAKYQGNQEYLRRFEREARASMRLDHPHICRSLSTGTAQGTRYLVMEVVEGPSLKALIQEKGPISERDALFLLEQMAAALGFSWDQGVLHRDVKPANIIIGPARPGTDEPFCAKLIDFGLAKVWQDGPDHTREESAGGLTGAGLALGTPHYMSPEQASGQADLDQRCDIYGLGASLYHALMGHTMYTGKSSAVIMYKQVTETIDLSELRRKGARKQLVELLDRMLAKDRGKRIATWGEVLAACKRVKALMHAGLGTGGAAGQSTPGATPKPAVRVSAEIAAAIQAQQTQEPAAPATHQPSARRWLVPAMALTALVVAALAGWRLMADDGPRAATPATLIETLRHAAIGEIRLVPGAYPAIRLGAAQAGLVLRAEAPGAVLAGLTADPGATVQLIGIDLGGPLALAPGARLTAKGGRLASVEVEGGRAELSDTLIAGTASASRQGTLILRGGRVDGGLRTEDGTVEASDLAVAGGVSGVRGTLRLTRVMVHSPQAPALTLDRCPAVELVRTHLSSGGPIGLAAAGSRLTRCEQVRITAQQTAISWSGATDATWSWSALTLEAPQPATGLPTALLAAAAATVPAPRTP